MRVVSPLGAGAWAKSFARAIRGSTAPSPSKFSAPSFQMIPSAKQRFEREAKNNFQPQSSAHLRSL